MKKNRSKIKIVDDSQYNENDNDNDTEPVHENLNLVTSPGVPGKEKSFGNAKKVAVVPKLKLPDGISNLNDASIEEIAPD